MVGIWVLRKPKHFFSISVYLLIRLLLILSLTQIINIFSHLCSPSLPFVVVLEKRAISRAEQYFLKRRKWTTITPISSSEEHKVQFIPSGLIFLFWKKQVKNTTKTLIVHSFIGFSLKLGQSSWLHFSKMEEASPSFFDNVCHVDRYTFTIFTLQGLAPRSFFSPIPPSRRQCIQLNHNVVYNWHAGNWKLREWGWDSEENGHAAVSVMK